MINKTNQYSCQVSVRGVRTVAEAGADCPPCAAFKLGRRLAGQDKIFLLAPVYGRQIFDASQP